MKNYVKVLERSKKHNLQKVIPLRGPGTDLTEWKALQIIEEYAETMRNRLEGVLPHGMHQDVTQVKLELIEKPIAANLLVKAQVYQDGKREALLKVFVYQVSSKGKAVKLARAVYHLALQAPGQVA